MGGASSGLYVGSRWWAWPRAGLVCWGVACFICVGGASLCVGGALLTSGFFFPLSLVFFCIFIPHHQVAHVQPHAAAQSPRRAPSPARIPGPCSWASACWVRPGGGAPRALQAGGFP